MAYVRITREITEAVIDTVDTMRARELANSKQVDIVVGTELYEDTMRALEETVWAGLMDIKDRVPEDWLQKLDMVSISMRLGTDMDVAHGTVIPKHGEFVNMPPTYSKWDRTEIKQESMTPLMNEWVANQNSLDRERIATKDLFGNISRQLSTFLEGHASINAALKEMPELEMYLPQYLLDKVAEKTVRKAKEVAVGAKASDVDIESLTRAAVAHRLTRGGL